MSKQQEEMLVRLGALFGSLEPLELLPATDEDASFCTPRGARLIARTGVDGVHFCDVPALGDTVFAVSPMGEPPYVCAVAESLADFLGEVLACGGAGAVEQLAWMEDAAAAQDFLCHNHVWTHGGTPEEIDAACRYFGTDMMPDRESSSANKRAGQALQATCGMVPTEDVYAHIQAVRHGFDLGLLDFSEEYNELSE